MRPSPTFRNSLVLFASVLLAACSGDAARDPGECASALLPGDVVISEIYANPEGPDTGREWLEIYNATDAKLDLAGLSLRTSQENGTSEEDHSVSELEIETGAYLVLGSVPNESALLPSHVDYGYAKALGDLRNSDARIAVACGDTVIDEAFYNEVTEGAARGYDGARTPDASGNDDTLAWCDATTPFAGEERGTPGAANDSCGTPTTCIDDGDPREIVAPELGDLVITEFHANPTATEEGAGEWFELYNASDRQLDLNGLEFGKAVDDPAGGVSSPDCVTVEPGQYLLFAQSDDPAVNGGLPAPAGLFDFALSNSSSLLYIARGGTVLDQVNWTSSPDGAASNLDPDYFDVDLNDDPAVFCEATVAWPDSLGDFGSPGAPNEQCMIAPPAGMCLDGDTLVAVDPPAVGEIVITEFMANPEAVGDDEGEWFELAALGDFHINGLELGSVAGEVRETVEIEPCVSVTSGDRILFARGTDEAANGGLPEVDATFGFALGNSNNGLFVGYGGAVLDEIMWASTTAAAATSLDPDATDAAANDDPASWCDAVDPYGAGDLGTPRAENPACGGIGNGMCNDGGTDRPIVSPVVGDVVITEIMPDPSAVADASGEWFEVLVTANVDLNGLELGSPAGDADVVLPVGGDCLAVTAGTRIVLARDDVAATNGGLPAVLATFSFGLTNGGSSLSVGRGGAVLDAVSWTGSSAGTALNLAPTAEDPVANDDTASFCDATMPYGDGDLGTPGAANTNCEGGGDGMCNDGGVPRAIVEPTLGDLVITEIMPDPAAVADADGEWFELLATADVDLNGLELGAPAGDADVTLPGGGDCLAVAAGTRVVFGRNADAGLNGGLPALLATFSFGLTNGGASLSVGLAGSVLDAVSWPGATAGASSNLDPGAEDPAANDDEMNFCEATMMYGDGDLGSPAAANEACQ